MTHCKLFWRRHHVSIFCSLFRISNELCLQAGLNMTNTPRLLNNISSGFAHCMLFIYLFTQWRSISSFLCSRMAHSAASSMSPFTTSFYQSTSPHSLLYRAQLQPSSPRPSPQTAIVHSKLESPSSSTPYLGYTSTITGAPGILQT